MTTPTKFTDKNLFAYCGNNPVMRFDDGGKLWFSAFLAPLFVTNPVGMAILAGVGAILLSSNRCGKY